MPVFKERCLGRCFPWVPSRGQCTIPLDFPRHMVPASSPKDALIRAWRTVLAWAQRAASLCLWPPADRPRAARLSSARAVTAIEEACRDLQVLSRGIETEWVVLPPVWGTPPSFWKRSLPSTSGPSAAGTRRGGGGTVMVLESVGFCSWNTHSLCCSRATRMRINTDFTCYGIGESI